MRHARRQPADAVHIPRYPDRRGLPWFFVLFILIIYLSGVYRDVLSAETADSQPYVLAVVTALGFFGSILLHELGHAVVAARNGIPISEITL